MSVPLSCLIITSYGARPVPAIARESCALAERLGRFVAQGLLHEDGAFCAVVLDAVDRMYVCGPEHVAHFARAAVRDHTTQWGVRRERALRAVSRTIWPMVERYDGGHAILAAAREVNAAHQSPLTASEVLAECRRIALVIIRRSGNARG